MGQVTLRKLVFQVEEVHADGGVAVARPIRKVAAAAVFENPFAGKYVEDLTPLVEASVGLAGRLAARAVELLGGAGAVESYGKACIVGTEGELEHAAALLHPKLGAPLREAVGGGKAILPSAKKVGAPGASIDVPLHYKDAAYVRSHYDAFEVRIPDAPKPREIVLVIAVTDGGRPHPRVGGLTKEEAKKEDGLR